MHVTFRKDLLETKLKSAGKSVIAVIGDTGNACLVALCLVTVAKKYANISLRLVLTLVINTHIGHFGQLSLCSSFLELWLLVVLLTNSACIF